MRVFSCILASIALLSACQPQSVTTVDGAVITVTASVPETIDTDTILELTFSDPIPASADLRDYISVSPFIDGTFAIATDGLSATFAPTPGWEPGVSYTVSVEDDAAFGNDTLAASSWTLQSPGWTEPAEQFATDGRAIGYDVATDSKGYVYLLIAVDGGSTFDGSPLSYNNQVFIQKFKPSGEKVWTKGIDANGNASASNFHINRNDEIIVGLTAALPADDANGALTDRGLIIALDIDGNTLAGYPLTVQPSDTSNYVRINGFRVAEGGELYLRGYTNGSLDGSQTGSAYVAKLSSDGTLAWVKQFNEASLNMYPTQMVLDVQGNAYLVMTGSGDFQGTTHGWACDSSCNSGAIMKMTAQGNVAWFERFGQDHVTLFSEAITINARGEVLAAYEYYFRADQASSTINEANLSFSNGMIMVRLDSDGNHLNTQPHGNVANGGNWPHEMLLTNDGTIIGTGVYAGSTWNYEGWLAEWDGQGVLINERAFPGTSSQEVELWALTMDPWGHVFATGSNNYGADNNYESSLVIKKLSFD